MKLLGLDFTRIAHDTFRIAGSKVVYTDPYKVERADQADLVLISHDHFDHLSLEDLQKVCTAATAVVASVSCRRGLQGLKVAEVHFVSPGDKLTVADIAVEAVPAYNLNKFREPGQVFHPRGDAHVGFVFQLDGTRVYLAGDTDAIPEMQSIRCDIALLPVSGTYVMTAEEASEAAEVLQPQIAVPMHYAAIVGNDSDAQKFKSLVKGCEVVIV
jgi:L-ascorbate metabolism protein UlaG (beta-lactamase superfamily)